MVKTAMGRGEDTRDTRYVRTDTGRHTFSFEGVRSGFEKRIGNEDFTGWVSVQYYKPSDKIGVCVRHKKSRTL